MNTAYEGSCPDTPEEIAWLCKGKLFLNFRGYVLAVQFLAQRFKGKCKFERYRGSGSREDWGGRRLTRTRAKH